MKGMTTNPASKIEPPHPPLARDPFGNLLAIPDGTSAWRISRETTGRPREIRGPDKQPVRFPLAITTDELVDLCGSGVYRVFALDAVGAQLSEEHVAKWDLTPTAREFRNVGALDAPSLVSLRPGAPAGVTDLRFALEAMTQMMRTNSDALRIVAESHVDLAKTLATAKGLPRNGAFFPTPLSASAAENYDDDNDDEDEDQPRHLVELLMPFVQKAAEVLPGLVMGKVMPTANGQGGTKALASATAAPNVDEDLANRPFEIRDVVDIAYAKRKGDAKRAAKEQQTSRAAAMDSVQARIMADPAVMQHLFAIRQQLAAEDIDTLMAAVAQTSEPEQSKFLDAIKGLTVEVAAEFCREIVKAIREQHTHDKPNPESR